MNHKLPSRLGVIYSDVKREYFQSRQEYVTEKDAFNDANLIADYIRKLGIEVKIFPGNATLINQIEKYKPEMVFNLVDSVQGQEYLSSSIPGLLELMKIPYTGTGMLGKSIDTNKFLCKKLLQEASVPTPNFQLFQNSNEPIAYNMRFPLITKLNEVHGSIEIDQKAVVETEKQLRKRLRFLIENYKQPVLVEEYIAGDEIVAVLLEGLNKKIYFAKSLFEQKGKYKVKSFKLKWEMGKESLTFEKYEKLGLKKYVRAAFEAVRHEDYARYEIRIDNSNRVYFIDTNANPAFGPKELNMSLSIILDMYGIKFETILTRLMLNTMRYAREV